MTPQDVASCDLRELMRLAANAGVAALAKAVDSGEAAKAAADAVEIAGFAMSAAAALLAAACFAVDAAVSRPATEAAIAGARDFVAELEDAAVKMVSESNECVELAATLRASLSRPTLIQEEAQ
jgi:hypothetical protein